MKIRVVVLVLLVSCLGVGYSQDDAEGVKPSLGIVLDLERPSDNDVLLLRNGDKLTGTILNDGFSIRTSYAQLSFNNRVVAGIDLEGGENNIESIITVNGNRFSGFIDDPVFVFKLQGGAQIEVRREKVLKAVFRVREEERAGIPQRQFVTLKNGDFFSGLLLNTDLVAETTYADVPLELDNIESITFIGTENPLTTILFKNGDSLQGILNQEDMSFELDVGSEVQVYQDRIDSVYLREGFIPDAVDVPGGGEGGSRPVSTNNEWTPVERSVDGAIMVQVPPGEFTMGSTTGDSDEAPTTVVTFDEGFWIDKFEVTRGAYQACVNAGRCSAPPNNQYSASDNQPINSVTWYQAAAFCAWRGAQLPTEGEWEYAARGPDGLTYPWGNNPDRSRANYSNNVGETSLVGTYPSGASWVGAMDMAGNVWEWTRSKFLGYPYQDTGSRNVSGVPNSVGGRMVLRGGSFGDTGSFLRSANRFRYNPVDEGINFGFRCLRSSL